MTPAHQHSSPDAPEAGGFILVGVIMFMLALTILGLSLFSLSSYEGQFFHASVSREQSLHNSESGLELVRALLAANSSRLEDSQYAVGQFGITRVVAYQANSVNPGDTTSRGPVRWDRDLFLVVAGRAGTEERTVESKFVPRLLKNPYHDLVTCGLGFDYNSANGGTRTVELMGKVWQHIQWPSDSAWTGQVNWSSGRPLDVTATPVPLADDFVDAKLAGATDKTFDVTHSNSGPGSYSLVINAAPGAILYYKLSTPQEVRDNSNDPELDWYGCYFDERFTFSVKGTCVLVVPDGACFQREVTIRADGNNSTGTLVIVAKSNSSIGQSAPGGMASRAISFQGGIIHTDPNIKVFLVSQNDVALTHDHNSNNVSNHESRALSVVCGGFEVMGPDPGSVFKLAYGGSAQNSVADALLLQGALPAIVGGSGSSFAYAGASWKETRLP